MNKLTLALGTGLLGALMFGALFGTSEASAADFPDPKIDAKLAPAPAKETAVLAGGCFWCVEAVFEVIEGVEDATSGYSGDVEAKAKYDIVSSGRTKHAEAVIITYDPSKITYGTLLKYFFHVAHDPTTLNRQGNDVGPQYRSAVFYKDEEQKRIAEAYIQQLNAAGVYKSPIVTEVTKLDKFYLAEGYHQDYAANNPNQGYIRYVSDPKVVKLKKLYPGCVRKRK
ncbi:MAG: peptide-methionine (S)-S-oxide reductase MsrA [Bryobacter sp.]|nr:peptide-methionine (S)-S-oxide reductase MsrA [Bryobacter sp.]